MNNKYQIQKSASRAIEIYTFALSQGDRSFTAESIPGWKWNVANQTSMKMLIDRELVRMVAGSNPRRYVLNLVTNPADCLNVFRSADESKGITRYRVPIGLLDRLGGQPGLINHQIKA